MEKKYELLLDDTITINDTILYRIKALRDFDDVKAGDLGGYVEKQYNLSHEGNCWVYSGAKVYGWANVCDDAKIYSGAKVYGWANVYGNAKIYDNAKVFGNAKIFGNAKVFGNADVCSYAELYGNAHISSDKDCLCVKGFGSANRTTTIFKGSDGGIYVKYGYDSFNGTLDEFETMMKDTHEDKEYNKQYKFLMDMCKSYFGLINQNKTKENEKMEDRKLEVFDISELERRLFELKEKEAIVIRWFDHHKTSNAVFSELNEFDVKYSVIVDDHIREFAKTYCNLAMYNKDYMVPKSSMVISLNMYNPDTVPSTIDMDKINTIIDVVIFENDNGTQLSNQKFQIDITQRDHINSYKLKINIYPNDVQGSSLLDLFDAIFEKMNIILMNDYSNYLMGF